MTWTHADIGAGERSGSHILAETKVSKLDKLVRQEHCGSAGFQDTLANLRNVPIMGGKVKPDLTILRLQVSVQHLIPAHRRSLPRASRTISPVDTAAVAVAVAVAISPAVPAVLGRARFGPMTVVQGKRNL